MGLRGLGLLIRVRAWALFIERLGWDGLDLAVQFDGNGYWDV